jgi:predicted DNA-binding protein (UPF0251 family)
LNARERRAILLTEIIGLTGSQAAKLLGDVTRQRVSMIVIDAKQKMRDALQSRDAATPMSNEDYDRLLRDLRAEVAVRFPAQEEKEAA